MKRLLTLSTLLLFFIVSISSCQKFADDTPKAIKKLIREKSKWEKDGARIFEYEYNNEYIYCYWKPCFSHSEAIFYNEKGVELWRSGETGNYGNYIEGFYENTIFKRIVWSDKSAKNCNENIRPAQTPEKW